MSGIHDYIKDGRLFANFDVRTPKEGQKEGIQVYNKAVGSIMKLFGKAMEIPTTDKTHPIFVNTKGADKYFSEN